VSWRRSLVFVVAGIVLLCVLVVFVSPYFSGPPTLRAKRTAGKLMGQFALSAGTVVENVQTATSVSAAAIHAAQAVPTVPILQLICVRIC
jgi:hypothetical protein